MMVERNVLEGKGGIVVRYKLPPGEYIGIGIAKIRE